MDKQTGSGRQFTALVAEITIIQAYKMKFLAHYHAITRCDTIRE